MLDCPRKRCASRRFTRHDSLISHVSRRLLRWRRRTGDLTNSPPNGDSRGHLPFAPISDIRFLTFPMFAPSFSPDKTERVLDFGYCLLRMKVGAPPGNGGLPPSPCLSFRRLTFGTNLLCGRARPPILVECESNYGKTNLRCLW